ncbi:MAG: pyridoxal phosphate-dependent aminotransferase [Bacteroidota bacterium]|nr:pyridoxal phosphate-dependent aminotransferase [Bacteroidota bacterium]
MDTPIEYSIVKQKIAESGLAEIGKASIRELKALVNSIEKATGKSFVRMEMGVPGLESSKIGVEAEIEALKNGAAAVYPEIEGNAELKKEVARFVKLFINTDVNDKNCIPTVGSMQGSFATFLTVNRMYAEKDTVLLIDPGFPVHKQQLKILGIKYESFDVYNFRGDKLREKLVSYLKKGNISCILYSNPNNPSWICFTDKELKIIGSLANEYNTVIMEDLAYFGMDFRNDISKPGEPPYQPSISKYTDNFIILISGSKVFSYAGQRIGVIVLSNKLYDLKAPDLKRYYTTDSFGYSMIYGTIYALSAGTSNSSQYALTAMLKAANDGKYNFLNDVKEYGEKARIMKKMFTDNGFRIVYDMDEDQPVGDGFYFTFSYPGFSGEELLHELLYYGISAISLSITGSERTEGLRACVSLVSRNQFSDLEYRLKEFNKNHSGK